MSPMCLSDSCLPCVSLIYLSVARLSACLCSSDRVTATGHRLAPQTAGFSSSLTPASHVTACGRRAVVADAAAIYEPRVWRPLQYVRSGRHASLGQVALLELTAPGDSSLCSVPSLHQVTLSLSVFCTQSAPGDSSLSVLYPVCTR